MEKLKSKRFIKTRSFISQVRQLLLSATKTDTALEFIHFSLFGNYIFILFYDRKNIQLSVKFQIYEYFANFRNIEVNLTRNLFPVLDNLYFF